MGWISETTRNEKVQFVSRLREEKILTNGKMCIVIGTIHLVVPRYESMESTRDAFRVFWRSQSRMNANSERKLQFGWEVWSLGNHRRFIIDLLVQPILTQTYSSFWARDVTVIFAECFEQKQVTRGRKTTDWMVIRASEEGKRFYTPTTITGSGDYWWEGIDPCRKDR